MLIDDSEIGYKCDTILRNVLSLKSIDWRRDENHPRTLAMNEVDCELNERARVGKFCGMNGRSTPSSMNETTMETREWSRAD